MIEKLTEFKINHLPPSTLSFVGDAVFSLFVRTKLVNKYDYKSGELTKKAASLVSAVSQSKMLIRLDSILTEEEKDIVKRCKNAYSKTVAKNASISEYHRASGLEGLIGWLYLTEDEIRLKKILEFCIGDN
ncbi:MAG: Mini-ribonuclease 3 [Firmicutes bacterium]|nr:Mini-ribonuclease 3 [Bacillota bacterium]